MSVTDGRNNIWTYQYDGYSRLRQQTDPLGNRTTTTYDDNGNPLTTRSFETMAPSGERILASGSVTYDLLNRPIEQTAKLWDVPASGATIPAGARDVTTTIAYDPASNVTSVTDAESRVTTRAYDSAERLIQVVDPMGNRTELELDPAGNPTTVSTYEQKPGGGEVLVTQSATFDALGRRSTASDALGNTTSYLYDARGQVRFAIDPEGFATETRYDGLDRPVETLQPEGIKITYGYDESSRRTLYRDALGNETTWGYDALNRTTGVTYPDQTTWTYGYDDSHNVTQIVDANGNQIAQSFDAANRLTARTVTPGTGVVGPTSETYSYDGLHRMVQAQSGSVVTALEYDSLSRLLADTTAGLRVAYRYDDVGNPEGTDYPSGFQLWQRFDKLNRPEAIREQIGTGAEATFRDIADYNYRGPYLRQDKSLGNGVTLSRMFDVARRLQSEIGRDASGYRVFGQSLTWNPRNLKSSLLREDLNRRGWASGYDGARRLQQRGEIFTSSPLEPNQSFAEDALSPLAERFFYDYDAAQNLKLVAQTDWGIAKVTDLPVDPSGRNRPAQVGGMDLTYDANGNLTAKGDLDFEYDFRNRLTRVVGPVGEVALYQYDAFNRRVEKVVDGVTETMTWSGWQPIEERRNGGLHRLRVYGLGLDEVVQESVDLDADGLTETELFPIYDDVGNLVSMTSPTGRIVERYEYTPFGLVKIRVDGITPEIEQVRVHNDQIYLGLSEEVDLERLEEAVQNFEIELRNSDPNAPPYDLEVVPAGSETSGGSNLLFEPTSVDSSDQVVQQISARSYSPEIREAVLRVVNPPAVDTALTLHFDADVLTDLFQNTQSAPWDVAFDWPSAETVVLDSAAPEVRRVRVVDGHLEIELSEKPDMATVSTAIDVASTASLGSSSLVSAPVDGTDSQEMTWNLAGDDKTLRTFDPLAPGTFILTIGPSLSDLVGTQLAEQFQKSFTTTVTQDDVLVFQEPDEKVTPVSSVANVLGFHGLPRDLETGFLYVRNRYYDPELGRFISADPLGYVDGPSMYGFAGYSPMNYGDPLGLSCFGLGPEEKTCSDYVPYFGIGYWTQQRGILSAQTKDMSLTNKERFVAAAKVNAQIPFYLLEEGLRTLVLNLPHDLASARDEKERCAEVAGQFDPLGDFEGYFQAMEESGCSVVEGPGVAAIPVGPGRLKRLAKRSPTHARVVRNVEESAAATRSSRFGASVSRATGALDDLLQGGRQVSGRFPRTAGPNEVLFRRDAAGRVTHYQIFDEQGLPLRRVDVTGKAHGEIPTPHVLEFERHTNPTTGETFVKPGPVRPALPEEIP